MSSLSSSCASCGKTDFMNVGGVDRCAGCGVEKDFKPVVAASAPAAAPTSPAVPVSTFFAAAMGLISDRTVQRVEAEKRTSARFAVDGLLMQINNVTRVTIVKHDSDPESSTAP